MSLQKVWDADNQYYTNYDSAGSSTINGVTKFNKKVDISDIYSSNLILPKYIKSSSGDIQPISNYYASTSGNNQTLSASKASGVVSLTVPFGSSIRNINFPNIKSITFSGYTDDSVTKLSSLEELNFKYIITSSSYNCLPSISDLPSLKKVTLGSLDNFALHSKSSSFSNCPNLTDFYVGAKIADVKALKIYDSDKVLGTVGDYDFSTVSDITSGLYIMSHATWHCSDGDYVPATGVETPSN